MRFYGFNWENPINGTTQPMRKSKTSFTFINIFWFCIKFRIERGKNALLIAQANEFIKNICWVLSESELHKMWSYYLYTIIISLFACVATNRIELKQYFWNRKWFFDRKENKSLVLSFNQKQSRKMFGAALFLCSLFLFS